MKKIISSLMAVTLFTSCATVKTPSWEEVTQTMELQRQRYEDNKSENRKQNEIFLGDQSENIFVCEIGTNLYSEPGGGKTLYKINRGERVQLVETLNKYYKVFFNNIQGYVLKSGFINEEKLKKEKRIEERQKQLEAQRKPSLIAEYGEADGLKIFYGQVWVGMSKKMARESWGNPSDINRTVGSWGTHEQWVYDNNKYLYFENGVLTSYQD